jgi:hypothetical protein
MVAPETCPHCGAEVPRNAKACPECGSCEETGWSDDAATSGLGLPEEDFDYSEFVKQEFGPEERVPRGTKRFWWLVAMVVLGIILSMMFW